MSFLGLPPEIRLHIYELSLTNLIELPPCPCIKTPLHRFATFWALSLTSREIHAEVTSLFCKKYANEVYIYFDDVLNLHDFYEYASTRTLLKDLHFSLRFHGRRLTEHPGDLDGYGEYLSSLDVTYPSHEDSMNLRQQATLSFCWTEPGFSELWKKYQGRDDMYSRWNWEYSRVFSFIPSPLPTGFRVDETSTAWHASETGGSVPCRTLYFPLSERVLQFSIHAGQNLIKELRGRLSDLTFEGIDMDLLKARIYSVRDSAWRMDSTWVRPPSPDMDKAERDEMDADSWGVPDQASSEATDDRAGAARRLIRDDESE